MAKRKRIVRIGQGNKVLTESPLRRLWEEKGKDTDVVRIHLNRLQREGVNIYAMQK